MIDRKAIHVSLLLVRLVWFVFLQFSNIPCLDPIVLARVVQLCYFPKLELVSFQKTKIFKQFTPTKTSSICDHFRSFQTFLKMSLDFRQRSEAVSTHSYLNTFCF